MSSVLKSQRTKSQLDYVRAAHDLEVYTIRMVNKKPKKHKEFLFNYLIKPVADINSYSMIIAQNFNKDNEQKCIIGILNNLQIVLTQLNIFYEIYKNEGITENEIKHIGELAAELKEYFLKQIK